MNIGRAAWRLLLAVAVGLICAVFMVRLGNAKKYRGRPLQHWVCPNATDRWGPDTMRHYQTNAVAAFREAGVDGVKLLLDELGCERNRLNAWRFAQARQWQPRSRDLANWLYFRWYSDSPGDRVQGASAILDQLLLDDRHLPSLARHFMNARGKDTPATISPTDFSAWVRLGGLANALARSGTNGAQIIAEALTHTTNADQLVLLVSALQRAHTNAAPWLSQILQLTTNATPAVRFQAGIAVRKIRDETELPANP